MNTHSLVLRLITPFLLATTAGWAQPAETSEVDDEPASRYQGAILSRATSLYCTADDSFRHTLKICSSTGCRSVDVTDADRASFQLAPHDKVVLLSTAIHTGDGAVTGRLEQSVLTPTSELRVTQTVSPGGQCLQSITLRLRPER